ncbi:MAG: hypothetical protein K2K77_01570 [Duncaniella sp.]|nr:hypothetical protein [Duncaniella sp.]
MDRSLFDKRGFGLSMTQGSSMRPLIWGGQHCVAVVPVDGEPTVGDLLMFRSATDGAEKNIVHRLVEVRQEGDRRVYITRGDNCLGCEQVSRDEIIGRVAEVHRMSGFRPWHAIPSRQFAVTDKAYRRYVRLWAVTWPARRLYYLMRAHARGVRARLRAIMGRNRRATQ